MTRIKIIPSRKRYGVPGNHPVRDRGRARPACHGSPIGKAGPELLSRGPAFPRPFILRRGRTRRSYPTCHPSRNTKHVHGAIRRSRNHPVRDRDGAPPVVFGPAIHPARDRDGAPAAQG